MVDNAGTGPAIEGGEDDADTIAYARRLGWRPESEFANAPEHKRPKSFISAKDFIEKTENEIPVLRERTRHLDRQLSEATSKLDKAHQDLQATSSVIKTMHESQKTANERAYARARAEIQAEMDAAARTGDPDSYDRSKEKLKQIEEDRAAVADVEKKLAPPPVADVAVQEMQQTIDAWTRKPGNEWYLRHFLLNQEAIKYEASIPRTVPLQQRLDQTSEWIEKRFASAYPEEFPNAQRQSSPPPPPTAHQPPAHNPRRAGAGAVAAPSGGAVNYSPKMTYDNLPADAQAACDKLCQEIPNFTKEDYIREYVA